MFLSATNIAVSAAILMASANLASAAEVIIQAQEPPTLERRTETVAFGDLNLKTDGGQAVLMERLQRAVKDVCGPFVDIRNLREVQDYHACGSVAMADATAKADTVIASAEQSHESVAALVVVGAAKH